MQRLKALFRARGIRAPGQRIYHPSGRDQWLARLWERGARFRAAALYRELDVVRELRPQAKAAMVAEARRDPAWAVLTSLPFFGPVRVARLLATMQTPWRFRTKRNLWAYSGLAVVTKTTAEYGWEGGRPVRRRRAPLTRGLNRNHNRVLKDVFKGAATAAKAQPGPLQDWYRARLAGGMPEALASVTLARKVAAIALRLWKTGERYDAAQLTQQAR
jgi:transposase